MSKSISKFQRNLRSFPHKETIPKLTIEEESLMLLLPIKALLEFVLNVAISLLKQERSVTTET